MNVNQECHPLFGHSFLPLTKTRHLVLVGTAGTNQKVLDHQTVYNASGRKVEEAEYDRKGQKWRKKYEYSPDGSLTRVLIYDSSNKLDNIRKFEFNELGRKKTEYVYDAKGKLKRCKVYEYSVGTAGD